MERLLVYHNPSCSKSRGALEILADEGVDHDVVEYLRAPPDRAALERIVDTVDVPPAELIRAMAALPTVAAEPELATATKARTGGSRSWGCPRRTTRRAMRSSSCSSSTLS